MTGSGAPLLRVEGLDVAYDKVQVLFGVDLEVHEGDVIALLGTNGAGKSTLLKAISGLVGAAAGRITFGGEDLTKLAGHEIVRRGVIQVPGGKGVFPSLTVAENLRAAGWLHRRDPAYTTEAEQRVLELFPELRTRLDDDAGNLSGGQQQMLTLGMAFIAQPRLLMIDELSLGLAPAVVERLLALVRAIQAGGATIILVEQSVNVALTVAETAYFMEKGEIRFHGSTAELLDRPDVLRSVFLEGAATVTGAPGSSRAPARSRGAGRSAPDVRRGAAAARTGVPAAGTGATASALEVAGLRKRFGGLLAVDDVSFTLERGQVIGIIGPNGAGKTTVFDLVSGFAPLDGGRVVLGGVDVTELRPAARARLGLGRSFQDARLFPGLTVTETIALALEREVQTRDPVAAALGLANVAESEQAVAARVDELVELMGLGHYRDKFVAELSTGTRRVVDLACVLAHRPSVVLFDEPSSGIAQREAEALGPLLRRIRDETGASLLVIEHDMPLVTSVADEMLALHLGRVLTQGPPDEVVNHPEVVASYLGQDEAVIARSGVATGRRPRRRAPLRAPTSTTADRRR